MLCPSVLYFHCIHHFLCMSPVMSCHTLHTCMTFLSALWWPNVSLYKHPRQLLTLTRSCTDRSTGASSNYLAMISSSGTPKSVSTLQSPLLAKIMGPWMQITSRTKWRSRVVLQTASNSFGRTPQSAARILLSTPALALAKQSDEQTSDGYKTQAVLSPSTVKRFLEANKLPHKEVRHAALPLTCPLCERETSQTVFINKTTGGLVCPPCKVHGELVRLGGPSAWSCCIPMHVCAYVCVYVCV